MTENLQFSEKCYASCPKIKQAIQHSIAEQALRGNAEYTLSAEFSLMEVRERISEQFPGQVEISGDPAVVSYAEECTGPGTEYEGQEPVLGGQAYGGVAVAVCGRRAVNTFIETDDDLGYL